MAGWFREAENMSSHGQRSVGLAGAVAVSFAIVAAVLLVAGNSAAEIYPKGVRGYVWDSEGRAVEAADVTVNIKDGATVVATLTDVTDAVGYYSVTADPADWEVGYTIEVIAEFNSNQESNSTVALSFEDAPYQWVNVTFTFEIPEFGGMTGLLVAGGAIGAVAAVSLVYYRKR